MSIWEVYSKKTEWWEKRKWFVDVKENGCKKFSNKGKNRRVNICRKVNIIKNRNEDGETFGIFQRGLWTISKYKDEGITIIGIDEVNEYDGSWLTHLKVISETDQEHNSDKFELRV